MLLNLLNYFKKCLMKDTKPYEPTVYFGSVPLKIYPNNSNDSPFGGDIIVYSIFLPEYNHLVNHLKPFLDIKELERAAKYYKETDKNRFIISRVLLKFALASYTQSTIDDISIELLPNKKPYIPKYPEIFFNVSHSRHYAIIAMSNKPIGIDIEYLNLNTTFQDTFRYVFDDTEIQFINNTVNQTRAFYSLWTRKEAFVKALGKGIDDDFNKIPCLEGLHILDPNLINNTQHWQVHDFVLNDEYVGAIAMLVNMDIPKQLPFYTFPLTLEGLIKMSQ